MVADLAFGVNCSPKLHIHILVDLYSGLLLKRCWCFQHRWKSSKGQRAKHLTARAASIFQMCLYKLHIYAVAMPTCIQKLKSKSWTETAEKPYLRTEGSNCSCIRSWGPPYLDAIFGCHRIGRVQRISIFTMWPSLVCGLSIFWCWLSDLLTSIVLVASHLTEPLSSLWEAMHWAVIVPDCTFISLRLHLRRTEESTLIHCYLAGSCLWMGPLPQYVASLLWRPCSHLVCAEVSIDTKTSLQGKSARPTWEESDKGLWSLNHHSFRWICLAWLHWLWNYL